MQHSNYNFECIQEREHFSELKLRSAFRKHGKIESIQLLDDGHAAYVTFVKDVSAHSALVNIGPEKFSVRPADTWHQPLEETTQTSFNTTDSCLTNGETSPILQLNEDCLIAMFKQCDFDSQVNLANVCKPFKAVLDRYFFPNVHSMQLMFNETSLAKCRSILRCIGSHVKTIDVDTQFSPSNVYVSRFLQKLNQYAGKNLRELSLHHLGTIDMRMQISIIEPILPRLSTLTIDNCHEKLHLDLLEQCTNLVKLKLCQLLLGWDAIQSLSLAMPNLQNLSVIWDEYYEPEGEDDYENQIDVFKAIIAQNPQLKCVKTHLMNLAKSNIVQRLPTLEKLSIDYSKDIGSDTDLLAHFVGMKNLAKLTLSRLWTRYDDIPGILRQLVQIRNLRELKIYIENNSNDESCYKTYQAPLISIAQELPHFEKCLLQGLTLLKPTIVKLAQNLQSFHIHHCKIFVSDDYYNEDGHLEEVDPSETITDMANARKALSPPIAPLDLYVDLDFYNNLDGVCREYAKRYLNINYDCKHKREFVDQEYIYDNEEEESEDQLNYLF